MVNKDNSFKMFFSPLLSVAGIKYSYLYVFHLLLDLFWRLTLLQADISAYRHFFFFFLLHWMQLMLLTGCHAEQILVKGFSLCCNPSLILQLFVWKSVNCLLILASATCLSGCSLLLPDTTLSGRHLRISLLPRCASTSKLEVFVPSSFWDICDG